MRKKNRMEPLSTVTQQHARRTTRFSRADWQELAGKAKGIHLLQPSNVLPEELSFTDNGALINCYSWFTGSQSSCTQGTFLVCGLQIDTPVPGQAVSCNHVGLCFTFQLQSLKQFYF